MCRADKFFLAVDDRRAGEIDRNGNCDEMRQRFANGGLPIWGNHEHHEAGTAGAEQFAAEGARLVLTDVLEKDLKETAAAVRRAGAEAIGRTG